jgi:hypothetical protein
MSNFQKEYKKYIWLKWNYETSKGISQLKDIKEKIPAKHGVYIIRSYDNLNRVKGSSNIIYIGQSGGGKKKGRQGIGGDNKNIGRLFNSRSKVEKFIIYSIEDLMPNTKFKVECCFEINGMDPITIESYLLKAYLVDHFELPPANHQFSKKLTNSIKINLT